MSAAVSYRVVVEFQDGVQLSKPVDTLREAKELIPKLKLFATTLIDDGDAFLLWVERSDKKDITLEEVRQAGL